MSASEGSGADIDPVEALRSRLSADAASGERDDRAPSRRLAEGLRRLIDECVAAEPSAQLVADAVEQLEALRRSMAAAASRPARRAAPVPDGRHGTLSDWLPVGGASNPLSPPLRCRLEGTTVVAEVTYGAAYEGPPACVHGGMIAAAFDEVLGLAQSLSGRFGMTGTLQVRYSRPTPLHVPLRIEGRYTRSEGRKIFTEGRIQAGGQTTATAEGIFIALDLDRFERVAAAAPGRDATDPQR